MFEEVEIIVRGKVQGVMYRDFVQRAALELGIVGHIENMQDGSVRAVAQGIPDALKAFINKLHEGSVLSRIDEVSVVWRPPTQLFDDFSVTYI